MKFSEYKDKFYTGIEKNLPLLFKAIEQDVISNFESYCRTVLKEQPEYD